MEIEKIKKILKNHQFKVSLNYLTKRSSEAYSLNPPKSSSTNRFSNYKWI